ncbi:lysozyme inhibitor LprI family protein [Serratia rubidaea]|uniref:lysozyme inhibitor LprI family protein n=1 Tax=Serratia rubidaea TaxID=61652 RepID=UPI000A9EE397|nr:lysozyme inhibitor LprI family protein [Serratia rubidaea]QPR62219.1 DUF1311 domain-containing protein [Serratia rubidaea]HAY0637102.1 DUF1311 domain-containing protein [Serratia rubidaea]
MVLNKIVVFCFFSFISSVSFANDECSSIKSTDGVDSCYVQMKNEAEKNLNDEYRALKGRVSDTYSTDKVMEKTYSEKLRSAQHNWLKYRDAQCSMEALFAEPGSSANASLVNKCMARIDAQRIEEMKALPY